MFQLRALNKCVGQYIWSIYLVMQAGEGVLIHLFTHWSACLSVCLSVCLSSSCLPIFYIFGVCLSFTSKHLYTHFRFRGLHKSSWHLPSPLPSFRSHLPSPLLSFMSHLALPLPSLRSYLPLPLQLPSLRSCFPTSGAAQSLLVSSRLCMQSLLVSWSFITISLLTCFFFCMC